MNNPVFSIDCETLSLDPRAVIIQIGAVVFDKLGQNDYGSLNHRDVQFVRYTTTHAQEALFGRHLCRETVAWWRENAPDAFGHIMSSADSALHEALIELDHWIAEKVPDFDKREVWFRGNRDAVWLETAYETLGIKFPFHYRKIKCIRSVAAEVGIDAPNVPNSIKHNALSDAMTQAMHVQMVSRKLNQWRAYELAKKAA